MEAGLLGLSGASVKVRAIILRKQETDHVLTLNASGKEATVVENQNRPSDAYLHAVKVLFYIALIESA